MKVKSILISSIILVSGYVKAADITKQLVNNRTTIYQINMLETEQISLTEDDTTISITKIVDSHCPPTMACFWPGAFVLDLTIEQANLTREVQIQYIDNPLLLKLEKQSLLFTDVIKKEDLYQIELQFIKPKTGK